jgi:selenocysteine lyase/cysteine desulfurase
MIPSQRHLFDIPDDVAYFNCAYLSPLMKPVQDAGRGGIEGKAQPWRISPVDFFNESEACRAVFARLINTAANNVAFTPSASYGVAVAARNVPVDRGQNIIMLEDQFPSHVYSWRDLAQKRGANIRTVTRQAATAAAHDGINWTAAILDAIDDDTAVVALPNCHWTDGSLVDLVVVGEAARACGAALVLDVTQSAGALPLDIDQVQPDFLACASYKWLLGPYSLGFLYVAPKWHGGEPLEHNWIARKRSEDFTRLVDYADDFQDGALRFDMGERASFHLMPMAHAALNQILEWGVDEIASTLRATTTGIAQRALELGLSSTPDHQRAGHFLGLRFSGGVPEGLPAALAARNIFVSVRGDSMRVTPHLFNTPHDVDRLFEALKVEL